MRKGVLLVFLAVTALLFAACGSKADNSPRIYIANEGDGTISVISSGSLEVVDTVKLEGKPHNVNSDPIGKYFYATNHEGEEAAAEEEHDGHGEHVPYLRIIDAKTNELLRSVLMVEMAAHVVPSRDGKLVYVSIEGGKNIVEVSPSEGRLLRAFDVGEGPHGIVLSNDGKKLFVPNMRSNDVSAVDLESGKEERISLEFEGSKCETPVAMGISLDDRFAFVTCGRSFEVYKIDANAKKVVGRVELEKGEFPGPIQVPVHPSGKFLYVPDMRHGVVHKIDVESFTLVKDIATGKGAHGIAYSADGKLAYVTNTWEDSVSVVDLESEKVVRTIKVGSKPNGIAVSNGKNQGW